MSKGFSLAELLVTIALMGILLTIGVVSIRPYEFRAKGRDAQRVSDLGIIHQAIVEYKLDNDTYPNFLTDLSGEYLIKIPLDPTNSGEFIYRYARTDNTFELDVTLEENSELMDNSNDGGDDNNKYELGTDLTLL